MIEIWPPVVKSRRKGTNQLRLEHVAYVKPGLRKSVRDRKSLENMCSSGGQLQVYNCTRVLNVEASTSSAESIRRLSKEWNNDNVGQR